MKHNWTYKKLGEVCNTVSGGTPSKTHSEYYDNGTIPWLRSGELSQSYIYSTEMFITEKGLANSSAKIVPIDTVSIAMYGATVGEVAIIKAPMCTNQAICNILPNDIIISGFLRYFLVAQKHRFVSLAAGGAQPNISQNIIRNTLIPIISISEQQAIVRELDGINRLIDLQEEQLREYDRLAQSLFYTTFGEEEKWQKATLKDICSSIIRGPFGSALKKDFFVPKSSDTYKVYEQKHAIQKNATIGAYYITKEKFEELKRFEVFPEDIIMSCSGTIGELFVIPLDAEKGVMNQALLKFHLNELATIPYFLFVMEYVKSKMTVQGCGLQNIGSVKEICKIDFPLPPLALQQSFAAQIEAIEQQKALVRKSLEDTRTLLAARMQYYFNS